MKLLLRELMVVVLIFAFSFVLAVPAAWRWPTSPTWWNVALGVVGGLLIGWFSRVLIPVRFPDPNRSSERPPR